ncbi:MAG: DUF3131 domain-containing protein [Candidatus Omnitrophica bacterium]|nr:DUF3131 domain-containing protein [Candidatus Omnitrophota bacterium]
MNLKTKERFNLKAAQILRIAGALVVFLFGAISSPPDFFGATTPEFDPYASIAPEKALQTSPQFILVDDFNAGKLKNSRGAAWQVKAPSGGALELEIVKGDGRSAMRGQSLQASIHLLPREKASFKSLLNRLDASQAEYFVFECRLEQKEPTFEGRIRVEIEDWRHESVVRDIAGACGEPGPDGWAKVILPTSSFEGLDLDQVFSIEFTVLARSRKENARLFIDEMAFFGFNDVAFESLRDNLVGFPLTVSADRRRARLSTETDDKLFLKAVAFDTWKFFLNARDKNTDLVVDHIRLGDAPLAADYTSPTNIAMDFLAIISAVELGFIPREEGLARAGRIVATLKSLRRYKGFFYNFYDVRKLNVSRSYISTVDSGWLALALVTVRQAFTELAGDISLMLDQFSFAELLDNENNQLVVGLEVPERNFGLYHYGMLVSEARATSFYAIGKGDISEEHWWSLYRTLPDAWAWQTQKPRGHLVEKESLTYFQGHYKYRGKKFVPSWGGSLFEVLMPTLLIDEKKLGPEGLGANDRISTILARDYALKEKKYPVWGISPAAISSGRSWDYQEFGVKPLAAKGYADRAVVTPHVSFLALEFLPKSALKNIRKLLDYPIYGEYGYYDSLSLKGNRVNPQYLSLDQGMILAALCNYLTHGRLREYFHRDPIAQKAEHLLRDERFFK